jgi:hypothetical protein
MTVRQAAAKFDLSIDEIKTLTDKEKATDELTAEELETLTSTVGADETEHETETEPEKKGTPVFYISRIRQLTLALGVPLEVKPGVLAHKVKFHNFVCRCLEGGPVDEKIKDKSSRGCDIIRRIDKPYPNGDLRKVALRTMLEKEVFTGVNKEPARVRGGTWLRAWIMDPLTGNPEEAVDAELLLNGDALIQYIVDNKSFEAV